MDTSEGLAGRDSADFVGMEPQTRDFLTGTDLNSYYSWLLEDDEPLGGQFLTLGVGVPTGGRHRETDGNILQQPHVPMNPLCANTGRGGMPTYNPQPGLHCLPSPPSTTSFPIFPGVVAVPKQNQSVTIGQPQGIHQLQPSPHTTSFGQLPGAANSVRPSQNSHGRSTQHLLPSFSVPPPVQSEARQATQGRVDVDPSQPHSRQAVPASPNLAHTTSFLVPPPVHFSQATQGRVDPSRPHSRQVVPASPNLAHTTSFSVPPQVAQGRVDLSQPHPRQASPYQAHTASFSVPPPVRSEASQATQRLIDPSQPHSRQAAPASLNLAHAARAVHQSSLPAWSQSLRPVPSQARKYADLEQRTSAAPTLQQRIDDLKASVLLAQQKLSSQSALSPAQQLAISKSPLPAPFATIRIQQKEEPHKLIGHNCYFCKRDLSYPPEGPIVENPTQLPEAAVLACGHSFHDFCLHRITPADSASDPPCIPCAVGEA